eukprot:CAMPEP_0114557758 /NCGR_PEP_ID=MMETSP0114-20121206/10005_1 /TAXON_ID=31324 /ORGANISM="Goniomonas sp, Strain m" /LENGTH=681 /DNA_ID=CAMNT_0001743075 /DNA_START=18 /DNA_END=2063 /DNA_ORIENTATION=+
MSARLCDTFARCKAQGRTAFVAYITASFPTVDTTIPALLALEAGGADVIELGVPFSDPMADGATIQRANEIALANGVTLTSCLQNAKDARAAGLKVPLVLMGYYNPILKFGLDKLAVSAREAGVDGLIIVDLPPEESKPLLDVCNKNGISSIPLVAPTTPDDRIPLLAAQATSFLYCVSVTGVTGARMDLSADLPDFIARIRKFTDIPLCVGFGISTREHVQTVGKFADGAVVGSAFINKLHECGESTAEQKAAALKALVIELTGGPGAASDVKAPAPKVATAPDANLATSFGDFGGRYIPETLAAAHVELEKAYIEAQADPAFQAEIKRLRKYYVGGPTPLYCAERLTKHVGGARIWLKREELAHTGAHKINNALGQGLLAKRLGKQRIIAETGAGQHGVATATACALLGLQCVVYMGSEDCKRQSLNVFRMKMLGAEVCPVSTGSCTLKDAINEAMRDWVTNVRTTHYIIGSAIGPHPFPTIVRDFQSIIGIEAREQMLEEAKKLPDVVVACVGGGSNAIGMFHPFVNDASVKLVGVEAGGVEGVSGLHSATLTAGSVGVLHGNRTFLLQDDDGQIKETHSISAGLDYPGVGPEHSFLKASGRAEYVCATDGEALEALQLLSRTEGIIPALEPSHAIAYALKRAATMSKDEDLLINLCGRGDKDMITVAKALKFPLDFL